MTTLPRLRTVATPDDTADLAVVQAFARGALNPGRTYPGRADDGNGWDPLSMEGPHRSTWHLTGYRLVGQTDTRAVYVFRFAVGSVTKYAAAVLDVQADPARVVTVHTYDYQPVTEQTRGGAEEKAADVLAKLRATDGTLTDTELAKIAVGRYTRLTVDQVTEALTGPGAAGQRPRIYAYWREQIVSVPSDYYLDRYREEARAWWLSGNTLADLIRPA